jgi:hypothetical protein
MVNRMFEIVQKPLITSFYFATGEPINFFSRINWKFFCSFLVDFLDLCCLPYHNKVPETAM